MSTRRTNIVDPSLHPDPAIGQWLWAIGDARLRTLEVLEGIRQAAVDWLPPDGESSIGAVLYHLAGIEADWLYSEVLEQSLPPEVDALFPDDIRDAEGRLSQIHGTLLEDLFQRLAVVRERLMAAFLQMDLAEFRRMRVFPQYDVTPEWVLHHLMQHEAEHRSQIGALRQRAERSIS